MAKTPHAVFVLLLAAAPACKLAATRPTSTGAAGAAGIGPAGAAGAAGTGTGGAGGSSIPGLDSLAISPTSATLMVTQGGPAQTQQYTVTGMVGGQARDLTTQVTYFATPSGVVSISAAGLATTIGNAGGVVTITATSGGKSATATLTVVYTFTGADPQMTGSVPANASTVFTSTTNDTSRAPTLVYPNDGVLFPPNVSGVEIHFTPGANNTLFEVSVVGTVSNVTSYIRCTAPTGINGCIYTPDPTLWVSIARSNAGQPAATLMVRGTDDTGTSVGASQSIKIRFSKDPIMGGLYYWTTNNSGAIMRWDFSGTATAATPYLTQANTDGRTCLGCHALSLDGSKLVASAGGQNQGHLLLWNVTTNTAAQRYPLAQQSQFESWNAAGDAFVGIYGDQTKKGAVNLMLFDGTSGAVTQTIDLGGLRADHPDWTKSMDGPDTIAFTSVDATATTTDQKPATGGIDFVQNSGGAWGAPQMLVPSLLGKNRYYPAISPDGTLVLYDESTCANTPTAGQTPDISCNADTDATATVYLTQLPPGDPTPVLLTNANSPGVADNGATALTNSFPKWAPFVTQLDEFNKLYWFTFSSTRQYGLRAPPKPGSTQNAENPSGTLIWMVGMQQGINGGDPSFAAFCLPFQDVTTSNHIAQWTKIFIAGPT
ncbi:MAG TPA: hypothetical protein VKQ32_02530 [Polyangia bacterium]|nr:hypothetical protein [Polyangia bacterium]